MSLVWQKNTHTLVSRFQKYSRSPVRKKNICIDKNKDIKLLPREREDKGPNKNPNEN